MMSLAVLISVIATVSCGAIEPTTEVPLSPEQQDLNERCSTCVTECVLPYPEDCHYFITCNSDGGNLHGVKMICPIGTYASPSDGKCVSNITCASGNYCVNKPAGETVAYDDSLCGTYLACDGDGNEIPKCCDTGYSYSSADNQCVQNLSCTKCELHNSNNTCTYSTNNEDGICGSYTLCLNSVKYSACCPDGNVYDSENDECTVDRTCTDSCPEDYLTNECSPPSVLAYPTTPTYCGTYITCNDTKPVEYRCCVPGNAFNPDTQKCEPTNNPDCTKKCPDNSHQDACPLTAVPEKADHYRYKDGNQDLPCAPGSLFSETKCGCAEVHVDAQDNSCAKDMILNLTIPLSEHGTAKASVQEVGSISNGKEFNGQVTHEFGAYHLVVPFFKSQLQAFYLSVTFTFDAPSAGTKMVIISNCKISNLKAYPSFEVYIQGTDIILSGAVEDENGKQIQFQVPTTCQPDVWNYYQAAFDGSTAWVSNVAGGGEAATNSLPVKGKIPEASSMTYIGACTEDETNRENAFTGSMAELEFTKCVKPAWVADIV